MRFSGLLTFWSQCNLSRKEFFFTITTEIHARSFANYYCQYADRHTNSKFVRRISEREREIRQSVIVKLTNWRQFFMRLSCYWSWISSSHCQSSCGSTRSGYADYLDNVMTKFIVNNRTDSLKTDINLFFTIINCRIEHARSLTRRIKFEIHVSLRILTIKISQWARVNFCSYRKIWLHCGVAPRIQINECH